MRGRLVALLPKGSVLPIVTHSQSKMSRHALLSVLGLAVSTLVNAQSATTALVPLASKSFAFTDLPYQVTGDQGGIRGPQIGYNLCNSSTENQQSLCQVRFCLLFNLGFINMKRFADNAHKHHCRLLHVEFTRPGR